MSDIYDVPKNSMKSHEEAEHEESSTERPGITPRKKGVGSFLRQMVQKGDADSVTTIFTNAMINAVSDSIDEITGNLTHRAKTALYGTEDYNRGANSRRGNDRYGSYSKYYEEKNGNRSRSTGSSSSGSKNNDSEEPTNRRWRYNEVFFDNRIFGKRGAELAAQRVIKGMDDMISDPEIECVSVADFFRLCKAEDPQNPKLAVDFTDENWGWDNEEVISNLKPIAVPGGYIIELPKPRYLR